MSDRLIPVRVVIVNCQPVTPLGAAHIVGNLLIPCGIAEPGQVPAVSSAFSRTYRIPQSADLLLDGHLLGRSVLDLPT